MIGILGGYGAVGRHAARLLRDLDAGPLRVGGRNGDMARQHAAALGDAEGMAVDALDPAALARFVAGCAVVVNCAGPSRLLSAAVATGTSTDLVDAGGDELLRRALATTARRVVLGAGGLPGVSGLLPRRLAIGMGTARTLTAYYAVFDTFTEAAAADYLDGVLGPDSAGLAGWAGGARRAGHLTRRDGVALPFVPGPVTLLPYLDAEGEAVARDLRLETAAFYAAAAPHLARALEGIRAGVGVPAIRRAAALDQAGRAPSVTFLVELTGDGTRTAMLRAPGISALTGAAAAAAAVAVLRGEVAPGAHHAGTALDPVTALDRLVAAGAVELTVVDRAIAELAVAEEGAL